MRTKALLLTAAVGAGASAAAVADGHGGDPVYSVNAVGYVNTALQPGFNLISNPLNNGDNTLNTLLSEVPDQTTVFIWNGAGYSSSTFLSVLGSWTDNATTNPGEGFFIQASEGFDNITFIGEVPQGDLENPIPSGFSINSSQVPQAGDLVADLGFPALNTGDSVFQFDAGAQSYVSSTYITGVGFAPAVSVGVGEAFFVQNNGDPTSWDRSFSPND